jgi:two-component system cell cycle response regulator DivK
MACILIVDDNPVNRKLAAHLLKHAGHTPLEAGSALEGIRIATESHPELVLMDIEMPEMDGVAALAKLRSDPTTATIKVLALTARAMKGDKEALLDAGFDAYLSKPIRYKEFLNAVEGLLGGTTQTG